MKHGTSPTVKYNFIESFCGAGGMSLGLANAGFKPLMAFDLDRAAIQTYCANLGPHGRVADARQVLGADILRDSGIRRGELALFAGGPPCQGFSKQHRGAHLGDSRNDLVVEYIRLVDELRPRFFLFENVAIFGQKRGKAYVKQMHDDLCEYEINFRLVNSADFGLAQTRERYLIVGRRRDQNAGFDFPDRICRQVTVGDVLKGLPEPPDDFTDHPRFPNHQRARVTTLNIERFSHVPQGGGWQDIPYELRLPCHQRVDTTSGGWPDVYGRLEWSGQCPTITGGFDSFTRGRYGHPIANRPLTPREAARLQGFPDRFKFCGTRGDIRSQIGNAVPPPLAEMVGINIHEALLAADGFLTNSTPANTLLEEPGAYQIDQPRKVRRRPAARAKAG
ncbi:MAG: DNA cytosine methyltransferase [Prosthecobacter sp.]|uniref:DNA cytosine methyltransferase n=1 Tax=Prosthecobacter sp. TaxID=1965333 RepID=UPI0025F9D807|nr:DNA cytosine methyltransferase [Prosthecobacter sp.]MCF7787038.1 DNA cytosine methyltransferase [Prosthecobacter sp.]